MVFFSEKLYQLIGFRGEKILRKFITTETKFLLTDVRIIMITIMTNEIMMMMIIAIITTRKHPKNKTIWKSVIPKITKTFDHYRSKKSQHKLK